MIQRTLTVENRAGIHARPATEIVKTASRYKSDIYFSRDSMKVNGKSVMGIITLGEAVQELFRNRFTRS